jgi:hypothetical protein
MGLSNQSFHRNVGEKRGQFFRIVMISTRFEAKILHDQLSTLG